MKPSSFQTEILAGLTADQKYISSKWIYDDHGSDLFEQITKLDEYYPTRTETSIFETAFPELAEILPAKPVVIEFGSGASVKIRKLIEALNPSAYVPIDIAEDFMLESVSALQKIYPSLDMHPRVADLTKGFQLDGLPGAKNARLGFFPGSTIGNFDSATTQKFLISAHQSFGAESHFLIGADLVKDKAVLEAAYDDAKGITSAFNKNLLTRINRELDAQLKAENFSYWSHYNEETARIEMYLVSDIDQSISIAGQTISFIKDEKIHTGTSRKYTIDSFGSLLKKANWGIEKVWTDENDWFGVFLAKAV